MTHQTYVCLDIETTGLDPQGDEIIEIAAVKFRDGETIDTFNSLVNPQRPVPQYIQLLCGIEQAQVDAAPAFSALAEDFVSFSEACPIIGHNIGFDLGFLSQKGVNMPNSIYDTLELTRMLLPELSEHNLAAVARHLSIPFVVQHRALADAMTTKEVFSALLDRAFQLDISTVRDIAYMAAKAGLGISPLFAEIEGVKSQAAFSSAEPVMEAKQQIVPRPLNPSPEQKPLDLEKLTAFFDDDGPLGRAFPDYERRQEQISMMQAVAQALNDGQRLIVEAGTGTGKSLAYLLPSILFALENNAHVVVSTNTINLQEQLVGKDIPDLLRALGHHADGLEVAQVKGRSNYLCPWRWNSLLHDQGLSPDELRVLARIRVWLAGTQTGDRSALNLREGEVPVWSKVCAHVEDCNAGNCPYLDRCFLFRARKAAQGAHIIVVNHALLLSDMVAGATILPEFHHLIIDEAHHLEDEATRQLGSQVTQRELLEHLSRIERLIATRLRERLASSAMLPLRRGRLDQLSADMRRRLSRARSEAGQFFAVLRRFVEENTEGQGEYDRHLRLTEEVRRNSAWAEVVSTWDELGLELRDISRALDELYIGLEGLLDDENLMFEFGSLLYASDELRHRMNLAISHPEEENIHWLTLSGDGSFVTVCTAPLLVGPILEQRLFCDKECVVLAGATLSTEGNFEYIKERLGLEDAAEVLLGSPFPYPDLALVHIARDIPEPNEPGYQQGLAQAIVELCRSTRGRTLVLFTSHTSLRATLDAVRAPLQAEGILVLGHGVDGPPKQLLEAFRVEPEAVLLGTASFWEGIDVPGEALSVLAVVRMPFNVPTDPVFAARSELFSEPFQQYALPQAAIKFKQGFGRLIRSKNDRGVMVVLDSRLGSKAYGTAFIRSLPPCTVVSGSWQDLPGAVAGWLRGGFHERDL